MDTMTMPMPARIGRLAAPVAWIALTIALGVSPADVHARKNLPPERPTDSELEVLPEACTARIKGSKEVKAAWQMKLGAGNFLHLHHYCFGLNYINRARMTMDKSRKLYLLQRGLANFNYVLTHWPADSPLRPDAEAGKQQVELMMRPL